MTQSGAVPSRLTAAGNRLRSGVVKVLDVATAALFQHGRFRFQNVEHACLALLVLDERGQRIHCVFLRRAECAFLRIDGAQGPQFRTGLFHGNGIRTVLDTVKKGVQHMVHGRGKAFAGQFLRQRPEEQNAEEGIEVRRGRGGGVHGRIAQAFEFPERGLIGLPGFDQSFRLSGGRCGRPGEGAAGQSLGLCAGSLRGGELRIQAGGGGLGRGTLEYGAAGVSFNGRNMGRNITGLRAVYLRRRRECGVKLVYLAHNPSSYLDVLEGLHAQDILIGQGGRRSGGRGYDAGRGRSPAFFGQSREAGFELPAQFPSRG